MKLLRLFVLIIGLCGSLAFGDFLSISPATTTGGVKPFPVLTITLPSAAPAGGQVVRLTSSATSVAKVPSSVTVPEGSTTATATVTTFAVATDSDATISGMSGASSGTATVHVLAARLQSITRNMVSLHGGTASNFVFKVTLSGKAPSGGVSVAISSNNTDLTVPATVSIPAGGTYASFQGVPAAVYADEPVKVTASFNGDAVSADVTILAPTVTGLTPTPQNLYGGSGTDSTIVVKLSSPAPSGGLDVPLTNDQPGTLIVPASIHVNGGHNSGSNTATAPNPVNSSVKATITATYGATKTAYIYVKPAEVSSLELSPSTVAGGAHSTATVTLNGPAGLNGRKVALSSSNSTVAHFASTTVTVHSGQSSATVDVVTSTPSVSTDVTLSATLVKTASATLTVSNSQLSGLSLDKSVVVGGSGEAVTGTVTLDQAAPAGGRTVTLSSSDASVTVPSTVTVPEGATEMGFSVTHSTVASQKLVTITATLDSVTKTQTLTVKTASSPWRKFHADNQNTGRGVSSSATGVLNWRFKTGGSILPSPSIGADGTVYAGSVDGAFYGVNSSNGTQKFKFTVATPKPIYSSALVANDGFIYFGGQSGSRLFKLNPSTVTFTSYRTSDWVDSSPVMASDGTVYVGSNDDAFYAVNSGAMTLKWLTHTGNYIDFSSPALSADGTTVYVGSGDHKVYAFDRLTGAVTWSYTTGSDVNSSPAINTETDTLYIGSNDGYLHALSASTGALKWKYQTGNIIWSAPAIGNDGTVYFGSFDNYVYALDGSTGALKWKYQTGDIIRSSPAISDNDVVYVGSGDGKLYAINGATGTLVWSYQTGAAIYSSPSIGPDGTIYVGSNDTYLYAIK